MTRTNISHRFITNQSSVNEIPQEQWQRAGEREEVGVGRYLRGLPARRSAHMAAAEETAGSWRWRDSAMERGRERERGAEAAKTPGGGGGG